jgi:hypothetical protein
MVFCTVPSANTLVRWVDERRLRLHSAGSTLPHLWPTGSSRGGPHRLRPGTSPHALRIPPRGGHPALRVTRGGSRSPLAVSGFRLRARVGFSIPSTPRPARNYPRFRIRRPSSGRRRDLNPPDHHAAQRTLRVLRRHSPFVGRAPRRRSRVPTQLTSEDGLGVPFVSLRLFTTAQPPRSAGAEPRRPAPPRRGHRSCIRRIRPVPLTVWALGFNRCRLRRAIRASTDECLGGFSILGLLASMLPSPLGFPAG